MHVPYKGMPDTQTAILRGDSAMGFTFFNVGGDLIQAGKMRALAVTGTKRMPQLPDVPTFVEGQECPRFLNYRRLVRGSGAGGDTKPIVDKVGKDIAEIVQRAEYEGSLRGAGSLSGLVHAAGVRPRRTG